MAHIMKDHVLSDDDLRRAIRELRLRADVARKEGHGDEAADIDERVRAYQHEMEQRL